MTLMIYELLIEGQKRLLHVVRMADGFMTKRYDWVFNAIKKCIMINTQRTYFSMLCDRQRAHAPIVAFSIEY
jgi:uncharacterized protein (DUF488 family)